MRLQDPGSVCQTEDEQQEKKKIKIAGRKLMNGERVRERKEGGGSVVCEAVYML